MGHQRPLLNLRHHDRAKDIRQNEFVQETLENVANTLFNHVQIGASFRHLGIIGFKPPVTINWPWRNCREEQEKLAKQYRVKFLNHSVSSLHNGLNNLEGDVRNSQKSNNWLAVRRKQRRNFDDHQWDNRQDNRRNKNPALIRRILCLAIMWIRPDKNQLVNQIPNQGKSGVPIWTTKGQN